MAERLGFIGAGNMAQSFIGGLIEAGHPAEQLIACDPSPAQRQAVAERFGVAVAADGAQAGPCAALVLAVKPQQLRPVCESLAPVLSGRPLLLSVAAGVRCTSIDRWLGGGHAVVRAMPNTPALVGVGATALYAAPGCDRQQRQLANTIAAAAGIVEWVADEAAIDAVTALSGSGPAYGFLLIEAMERTAVELGLPAAQARRLAVQTLLGAASMARDDGREPAALREAVTSPGGTTAAALAVFEAAGLRDTVGAAMRAAHERAWVLADRADRADQTGENT